MVPGRTQGAVLRATAMNNLAAASEEIRDFAQSRDLLSNIIKLHLYNICRTRWVKFLLSKVFEMQIHKTY